MKVDLTQGLLGIDDKPLQENEEPILLRTVCINALMATLDEDRSQTGEEKLSAWTLAKRLQDEAEPDLMPEELARLKDRVGKCFGPMIVGPAYAVLNGHGKAPA